MTIAVDMGHKATKTNKQTNGCLYNYLDILSSTAYARIIKVSKGAKIRNRYNQVPHLTQDTNGKVTNSQKTPQTRAKRSALSQQVTTKHILTDAHKEIANTRQNKNQNHRLRMDSSLSHWGGGGLNAFYWYKIIAQDSDVVKSQKLLISHGGFLTNAMYHHRETVKSK